MKASPPAGRPAQASMLVNVPRLVTTYYTETPDPSVPEQRVAFGTSGLRGSLFDKAFNEWHTLAISQAICQHRKQKAIDGPSGTGDIRNIYAESFQGTDPLRRIIEEAQAEEARATVNTSLAAAPKRSDRS